jgi:hypothetical protein
MAANIIQRQREAVQGLRLDVIRLIVWPVWTPDFRSARMAVGGIGNDLDTDFKLSVVPKVYRHHATHDFPVIP